MSLQLHKLDPARQIAAGSIIHVISKRNTGKSILIKGLCYKLRDKIDFCICFAQSTSSAESFASIMPPRCIYQTLDLSVVDRLMAYQKECAQKGKRVRSVMIIFDDCSWEASLFKKPAPTLAELYRNGRHLNLTVCAIGQDHLDYHIGLRGQVDCYFFLREGSVQIRKRIHSASVPSLTLNEFHCVMDTVTENYGALVVLNTVQKNSATECLFWWRARYSLPRFKLVNDCFYTLAERLVPEIHTKSQPEPQRKGGVIVETCGDDETSTVVSA